MDYVTTCMGILDEEPVVINSVSLTDNGLQIEFVDADEQTDSLGRMNVWVFEITDEVTLEAFRLLQDIGRVLVQQARTADRDVPPPHG